MCDAGWKLRKRLSHYNELYNELSYHIMNYHENWRAGAWPKTKTRILSTLHMQIVIYPDTKLEIMTVMVAKLTASHFLELQGQNVRWWGRKGRQGLWGGRRLLRGQLITQPGTRVVCLNRLRMWVKPDYSGNIATQRWRRGQLSEG